MKWLNVEDTLPELHKAVLISDGKEITIGFFRQKDSRELIWDKIDRGQYQICFFLKKITHWMPLPEPPKDK